MASRVVALTSIRRVLAGAVALVCAGWFSGLALAAPGAAPSQLVNAAVRDAEARGSARETQASSISGVRVSLTSDVALRDGRQRITASGIGVAQVLVVSGAAYCSGSTLDALMNYCDTTPAASAIVGRRWLRIVPSGSLYASIAGGVTLASVLEAITPSGKLTQTPPKTIGGVRAIGVTGRANSTASPFTSVTLWISSSHVPLPLAATFSSSTNKTDTSTATLGNWGEHIAISPPVHAVAYTSLPH
jgi:hypothetical protein